jgi:hypothetical protein
VDSGDACERAAAPDADVPPGLEHARLEPRAGVGTFVELLDLAEVARGEEHAGRRVVAAERLPIDESELEVRLGGTRRDELGDENVHEPRGEVRVDGMR